MSVTVNSTHQEYTALTQGAAFQVRPEGGVLELGDADRVDFLHRMTTNDIATLQSGQSTITILTSPTARTCMCIMAHENPAPLCVTEGNSTACTKALVVILNANPNVASSWTVLQSSDYPESVRTGLPDGGRRRTTQATITDGISQGTWVYNGGFSTTHLFIGRFSKTVVCEDGTCSVTKTGACIRCPYPAGPNEARSEGVWGSENNFLRFANYARDCRVQSTHTCAPGTGEYQVFTELIQSA